MDPELRACTDAIDSEASLWEAQSGVVGGVAVAAEGLRMNRLQAGLFQLVVDTNNDVCSFVSTQGTLASSAMSDVADALRRNAVAYRRQEAETTASVENAY